MWDDLPSDLVSLVWSWRRSLQCALPLAASRIQSAWRRYRVLVLVGRFRMLRYLHDFRAWNPSLSAFLHRARL